MPKEKKGQAPNGELTLKQRKFVQEYLKSMNAREAARRAGYAHSDSGWDVLKNTHVRAEIDKELKLMNERFHGGRERLIAELQAIAYSNLKNVAKWDEESVDFKASEDLDHLETAALQEISSQPGEHGTTMRVRKHDKLRALELLGKIHGVFDADKSSNDGTTKGDAMERLQATISKLERGRRGAN